MTDTVKLSDIILDERNVNQHTERGEYMIREALQRFGFAEAGTLDVNNRVIGGNLRTEAAADVLAAEDAIVIDVDGTKPVYIRRKDIDLTTPRGRELAFVLNRVPEVSQSFDFDLLAEHVAEGLDVTPWYHPAEIEFLGLDVADAPGAGDKLQGSYSGRMMADDWELPGGVPDTLWPTDNEYGIPLLDIHRQADAYDQPIETWGAKARSKRAGIYHFYTEDMRFRAIWYEPDKLIIAGCVAVVEPNFSVYENAPMAVAIWNTYKKRWLARYWQSKGVRVFVDLNVGRPHDATNMLGVPRGWKSYATRGYTSRLDGLADELEIATIHAGGPDGLMSLVYGGGVAVKDWCGERGLMWVPEDMDRGKGKYLEEYGKVGNV